MMIAFTIRKFQPSDLGQILELFRDTIHSINIRDYSKEQIAAWAPEILDREKWLHSLSNNITYVAEISGNIVGFGDANKDGYLDRLYTHKDFQGKGIATAILKKLEEELKKLGITEVFTEASITAKPFFERHGYDLVRSQEKKHRSGIIFLNYVMKKKLMD